jgi:TfoX/Sxy family transcriptional regulator of competence genes
MAFDQHLAERVRAVLGDDAGVVEQPMFGGLAFLVDGHMACGIVKDQLMVRLGAAGADAALERPHVRPMDFTGRPMRAMVFVEPAGVVDAQELRRWVEAGVEHARSLPPKDPNGRRRRRPRRPRP